MSLYSLKKQSNLYCNNNPTFLTSSIPSNNKDIKGISNQLPLPKFISKRQNISFNQTLLLMDKDNDPHMSIIEIADLIIKEIQEFIILERELYNNEKTKRKSSRNRKSIDLNKSNSYYSKSLLNNSIETNNSGETNNNHKLLKEKKRSSIKKNNLIQRSNLKSNTNTSSLFKNSFNSLSNIKNTKLKNNSIQLKEVEKESLRKDSFKTSFVNNNIKSSNTMKIGNNDSKRKKSITFMEAAERQVNMKLIGINNIRYTNQVNLVNNDSQYSENRIEDSDMKGKLNDYILKQNENEKSVQKLPSNTTINSYCNNYSIKEDSVGFSSPRKNNRKSSNIDSFDIENNCRIPIKEKEPEIKIRFIQQAINKTEEHEKQEKLISYNPNYNKYVNQLANMRKIGGNGKPNKYNSRNESMNGIEEEYFNYNEYYDTKVAISEIKKKEFSKFNENLYNSKYNINNLARKTVFVGSKYINSNDNSIEDIFSKNNKKDLIVGNNIKFRNKSHTKSNFSIELKKQINIHNFCENINSDNKSSYLKEMELNNEINRMIAANKTRKIIKKNIKNFIKDTSINSTSDEKDIDKNDEDYLIDGKLDKSFTSIKTNLMPRSNQNRDIDKKNSKDKNCITKHSNNNIKVIMEDCYQIVNINKTKENTSNSYRSSKSVNCIVNVKKSNIIKNNNNQISITKTLDDNGQIASISNNNDKINNNSNYSIKINNIAINDTNKDNILYINNNLSQNNSNKYECAKIDEKQIIKDNYQKKLLEDKERKITLIGNLLLTLPTFKEFYSNIFKIKEHYLPFITRRLRLITLEKGEYLFQEGDKPNFIFIFLKGCVVPTNMKGKKSFMLRVIEKYKYYKYHAKNNCIQYAIGSIIGHQSFMFSSKRDINVITLEKSVFAVFDITQMELILVSISKNIFYINNKFKF